MADMRAGGDLFRAGRFRDAAARFQGLATAASRRDLFIAARATGNLGGCRFALHQYLPALDAFLEARRLAQQGGDASAIAAFDANIASLYTEMGDLEAAAHWISGTRERLSDAEDRRAHLPELLLQLATIRARQGRLPEARGLFRQGIRAADQAGDLNLYAIGWNRWGEELLKQGDLTGAEPALLEAYRVRKLNHLALDTSYRNLGRLRLEQGDLHAASTLLDKAVELASQPQGQIPGWDLYHYRGRVRLAQGRLREAFEDLRTAVRLGRAWRWSAAAGDSGRIGQEGWLDRVHSAMVEAGNRLYLATGDRSFARETFEALEENRASSLRLLRAGRTEPLPDSYWEALLRLQRAEVQALRSGAGAEAAAARESVERLETSTAPAGRPGQGGILERTQAALGADRVLLSFHLGESMSWMWAVDRLGVEVYELPPASAIAAQVEKTLQQMRDDRAGSGSAAAGLYSMLFGKLPARFQRRRDWLLALDDALFNAPLAALPEYSGGRVEFLVERHSTLVIPGVGWWLDAAKDPRAPLAPLFLGVGDPVYNKADSRFQPAGFPIRGPWRGTAPIPALPRLMASGSELDACARVWRGDRVLLKGSAASRGGLQEQLQRNPTVVHFATHILESPDNPTGGQIALSLAPGGEAQTLAPQEIAQWRIRAGLVVLSGCHSAAGKVLPGTGLLGLTRAWLAAGAGGIIGTRWATPDDTGALFIALYRHLGNAGTGPAQALREAQLDMLRSGDWRARPRYWAAYFAMGMESMQ